MKVTLRTDITVKDVCEGFEYNEYEGNVVIQGSTIPDGEWYTIIESDNYSNITDTKGYTIIGFHPFVRLQFNSDQGEVDNILAR